jgi:HSP20 family protein
MKKKKIFLLCLVGLVVSFVVVALSVAVPDDSSETDATNCAVSKDTLSDGAFEAFATDTFSDLLRAHAWVQSMMDDTGLRPSVRATVLQNMRTNLRPLEESFLYSDVKVDIKETEAAYIVQCDLPGMDKDAIQISFEKNYLTISGERKKAADKEREEDGVIYRVSERSSGAFRRTIAIPDDIKDEKIEAKYENGVLQISIPRLEKGSKKNVRTIEIL